jgi:hypothetical protein
VAPVVLLVLPGHPDRGMLVATVVAVALARLAAIRLVV